MKKSCFRILHLGASVLPTDNCKPDPENPVNKGSSGMEPRGPEELSFLKDARF